MGRPVEPDEAHRLELARRAEAALEQEPLEPVIEHVVGTKRIVK